MLEFVTQPKSLKLVPYTNGDENTWQVVGMV